MEICKNVAGLQDESEEKRDNKRGGMMLPEVQTMNNTTTAPPGSRELPDDGGAGSTEDFPSELCRLQEVGGNVNPGSKRQLRDLTCIEDGAILRGDVVLLRGGGKGASRLLRQGKILLRGGAGAGVVADRPTAGRGARGERAGICSAGTAAENAGTAQGERVGSGVWTGIIQCELLVRGGAAGRTVRLQGSRERLSSGEAP